MILELDLGNTRCKWRLVQGETVVMRGNETLEELPAALPTASRIRVASVLSHEKEQRLSAQLRATIGVEPEFARSCAVCAGVRNAYAAPEQLGVDRWLALLAAYRAVGDRLLLVSAGTAVTLDELSADGLHVGGYILPGRELMLDSLSSGTDRVRFEQRGWRHGAGRNTGECVAAGVSAAIVGSVLAVWRDPLPVVLTGGYAEDLAAGLASRGISTTVMPELVMDGLRLALP